MGSQPMSDDRRVWLREYNTLRGEVQEQRKQLKKLEAHEGEDGTAEDVDAQCALVDAIGVKERRIAELRKLIYPT